MVTKEDFGKRFKQIRLEKGVTEKEMGKAIGHTEKYIKNIENGVTLPTLRHFFRICDYFGITAYLFFRFDIDYPILFNELLTEIEKLSDKQKDMVSEIVNDIIKSKERTNLEK